MAKLKKKKTEKIVFMDRASELHEAVDILVDGFDWSSTCEGNAYWEKVYERLQVLAEQARKKTSVRKRELRRLAEILEEVINDTSEED